VIFSDSSGKVNGIIWSFDVSEQVNARRIVEVKWRKTNIMSGNASDFEIWNSDVKKENPSCSDPMCRNSWIPTRKCNTSRRYLKHSSQFGSWSFEILGNWLLIYNTRYLEDSSFTGPS
jgi:hypothetical protein